MHSTIVSQVRKRDFEREVELERERERESKMKYGERKAIERGREVQIGRKTGRISRGLRNRKKERERHIKRERKRENMRERERERGC